MLRGGAVDLNHLGSTLAGTLLRSTENLSFSCLQVFIEVPLDLKEFIKKSEIIRTNKEFIKNIHKNIMN